jgi:hypothetical protein
MKARRLKALGFTLLGSLALLFAGCGQQAGGGTGSGAVTSVGIQLPQPPPGAGGYNGVIGVDVTVNEGARVRRIVLKVDGQQVSQIDVAGLRPQAITYTLFLDTAQLDPATNQPRFRNGTHTLTVEVTDANNNTRSASTTVTFRNQDYVRGIEVSQTDNPRAPVTSGNIQWYGNGDVFVTVDIVNYSGATYRLSGGASPYNLQASGGQGGSLSGLRVEFTATTASATPVSGQPQLKLAKSNNSGVEDNNVTVRVIDSATPANEVARKTFGLDNQPPNIGAGSGVNLRVQFRRIVREYDFSNLSTAAGSPTRGNSQTLFRGDVASDGGVDGITYRVAFRVGGSTVVTATLPGRPSPGVTVSGLSNSVTYEVRINAVEDALGNRATVTSPTSHYFQLAEASIGLGSIFVTPVNPSAPSRTFDVSFSISGGFVGTLASGVALKLGNRLVEFRTGTTTSVSAVPALFGAQYALFVVDEAGNFAVADLPVTVSQSSTDQTPPTITVSLPSSVSPSSSFDVSGTYSDPNPPSPSNDVVIYRSHGSLGGFEWYRLLTSTTLFVSGGSYGTSSVTAPSYKGSLGVVVRGRDAADNLGFATGTVNVE